MTVPFTDLPLDAAIIRALAACKYNTPTAVQAAVIPTMLAGKNLIASANTGTGKTAAFALPALQSLVKNGGAKKKGAPKILVLTPTRELACQVSDAFRRYGAYMRFHGIQIVGGMAYGPQLKGLSRPVDVVTATPGRLSDMVARDKLRLSDVSILILDEADRMLDMGFIDEVQAVADAVPDHCQTVLFTATWEKRLARFADRIVKNPERICIETTRTKQAIEQVLYLTDDAAHKRVLLDHILSSEDTKQIIIFSGTKVGADVLAKALRDGEHRVSAFHGDMPQRVRSRVLERFRAGKVRALIATDVAARGIDVQAVSHVVNYDMPRFAEDYVHRIGRTGRAGAAGMALSFVLPSEMRHVVRIERYIDAKLSFQTIMGLEPKAKLHAAPKKAKKHKKKSPRRFGGHGDITKRTTDKAGKRTEGFRATTDGKKKRFRPKSTSAGAAGMPKKHKGTERNRAIK